VSADSWIKYHSVEFIFQHPWFFILLMSLQTVCISFLLCSKLPGTQPLGTTPIYSLLYRSEIQVDSAMFSVQGIRGWPFSWRMWRNPLWIHSGCWLSSGWDCRTEVLAYLLAVSWGLVLAPGGLLHFLSPPSLGLDIKQTLLWRKPSTFKGFYD
jgi:hypothetical protein